MFAQSWQLARHRMGRDFGAAGAARANIWTAEYTLDIHVQYPYEVTRRLQTPCADCITCRVQNILLGSTFFKILVVNYRLGVLLLNQVLITDKLVPGHIVPLTTTL